MTNNNVDNGKENSSPASRRKQRPSRRVEGDLRRRVLREQTCKQLLFDSSLVAGSAAVDESNSRRDEKRKPAELSRDQNENAAVPPQRISCEEKVVQLRRKLEKIVHRRESNESKALDYLATLDRMRISQQVPKIFLISKIFKAIFRKYHYGSALREFSFIRIRMEAADPDPGGKITKVKLVGTVPEVKTKLE